MLPTRPRFLRTDTTLLTLDEDSRQAKRQERGQLQKTLQESLAQATATAPPTEDSLQRLAELLADTRWHRLEQLVEEMKYWDAATTIPEPRSFLYYARQQGELHRLLTATAANHAYLRLIIERFGSDNERIAPDLNGPLHYAVEQLDAALVEWLLGPDRTTDVNLRNNAKKSALTILCEAYDRCIRADGSTLPHIRSLIERLLEAGASFNVCSVQLKLPFELLLKHGPADEATRTLVDRCVRLHRPGAIAICQSSEPNVRVVGFYNNDPNVRLSEELLEIYLRYNDERQFLEHVGDFAVSDANAKKAIRLLLHTAIEQGLSECVRRIVAIGGQAMFRVVHRSRGARGEPQKSSELVHRVELKGLLKKACLAGDLAVVQLLLSRMTDLLVLNDDPVLALTLTKAYDTKRRPEERHALLACAEFLTTQHTIYISKADNSGNTPLHLALKYGFLDVAAMLLDQRYAFIGVCNRDNLTPLDYGSYGFWKAYFDRCIKVDVERSTQDRNVLRFNLNCLEQPLPGKGGGSAVGASGASTALLARPPRSCQWKLVQQASADTGGPRNPHKCVRTVTEMTAVRKIAQSKELKRLLIHPVIYTFIMVKWMRLSHWTYLNLVLTTATVLVFGAHSLTACSAAGSGPVLRVLAILGTVFIGGREFLQLLFLRQSYGSPEQALDLVTVGGMCAVLWRGCSGLLASFVMISFAMQLTFLLGSLPFNSLSTIMYMFKTVSQNFLKSFLLFVPLIGAFVFAFHLTYNEPAEGDAGPEPSPRAADGNGSTEDSFNNFRTFWNATIKTLVMTTGEFEAAAIDFSGGRFCLFIVFLFFAPIVILNLINGLAVSDIAAIREESELISISKKVMLLERYERGVASVQPALLRSLFPEPFFHRHTCWIHVRTKESRKIVVHRLQAPAPAPAPTATKATKKTKPVPLSLSAFSFLCPDGTDYYVNLRLFRFTTFMNLDRAILNEALAVIEKQHPVSGAAVRLDLKPLHDSGVSLGASSLLNTATTTTTNSSNIDQRAQETAQVVADLQTEIQELRATMRQVLDVLARRDPSAKRPQTQPGIHQTQTKATRKRKAAKKRQLRQELGDGDGDSDH
ncbi:transient receptor potential cation channel protein painless-like [Anopheles cruzii]|uniref:transient receptor potential cation channel protein painless-like n=1 Tax=Anopheles cruzii TaxID=68878 RepID=UPI0022EC9740|nr:transient receptor potential cation channel protein painless-like [Anopheles cruzii]